MKNLQAKIKRIEDETNRIDKIDTLIECINADHLKAAATFSNGGSLSNQHDVVIDKDIMIQMLAEQKLTIELEIEEDVKFITAIELLATPKPEENPHFNGVQAAPANPCPPAIPPQMPM